MMSSSFGDMRVVNPEEECIGGRLHGLNNGDVPGQFDPLC